MLERRPDESRRHPGRRRRHRRRPGRQAEDPPRDESASHPRERPDEDSVVLEEPVRHREREHDEQRTHEERLNGGRTPEEPALHMTIVVTGQGYTRRPRGG